MSRLHIAGDAVQGVEDWITEIMLVTAARRSNDTLRPEVSLVGDAGKR
jgi:hypothetical protein